MHVTPLIVAAPLLLASAGNSLAADLQRFDSLVTPELISAACRFGSDFSLRTSLDGSIRTYQAAYQPRAHPLAQDDYYILSINVAPAQTFLAAARYQQNYDEYRRIYADRGAQFLRAEFPLIGARAQREFFGFGPGGSGHGVTFTTKDELYDVRIIVQALLSNDIPDPDCDVNMLAERTEAKYESRQ